MYIRFLLKEIILWLELYNKLVVPLPKKNRFMVRSESEEVVERN